MRADSPKITAREKLLQGALRVIRERGYSATTVDDLCASAKVTKGAFFHHFQSKEELAVQAAAHWSQVTGELFAQAPYHEHADPLDRVLGYLDFRKQLLRGQTPEFTCLVGTMVQETFASSPDIREACRQSIFGHAAQVARDIKEAKKIYAPDAPFNSESLALHIQAVIQGAFILAKAKGDAHEGAELAADSLDHLRAYVEHLFPRHHPKEKR